MKENQTPDIIQKLCEGTRHEQIPNPSQSVPGVGLAGRFELGQV